MSDELLKEIKKEVKESRKETQDFLMTQVAINARMEAHIVESKEKFEVMDKRLYTLSGRLWTALMGTVGALFAALWGLLKGN